MRGRWPWRRLVRTHTRGAAQALDGVSSGLGSGRCTVPAMSQLLELPVVPLGASVGAASPPEGIAAPVFPDRGACPPRLSLEALPSVLGHELWSTTCAINTANEFTALSACSPITEKLDASVPGLQTGSQFPPTVKPVAPPFGLNAQRTCVPVPVTEGQPPSYSERRVALQTRGMSRLHLQVLPRGRGHWLRCTCRGRAFLWATYLVPGVQAPACSTSCPACARLPPAARPGLCPRVSCSDGKGEGQPPPP
ncbi:hypothetical protein CB1_000270008 [Camelus ferus]|nr:hypothetical protein CB1_000270008 [Camelus ferus]